MRLTNRLVGTILRSPAHRLLSGSTDLLRYTGRRSGRTITTPTQYARLDDGIVILVGRPEQKAWWRNFRSPHDLNVLLEGRWTAMTGQAIVGDERPERVAPLLDTYLERFPRATKALAGATRDERARQAVVVWCRPDDQPGGGG